MRECAACGQPIPCVIKPGDVVQHRVTHRTGVVRRPMGVNDTGVNDTWLSVTVLNTEHTDVTWRSDEVDLLHGFFHITERL